MTAFANDNHTYVYSCTLTDRYLHPVHNNTAEDADMKYDDMCQLCVSLSRALLEFEFYAVKLCATLNFTSASTISINLERGIYELIMQNYPSDWHRSFLLLSVAFYCNIHYS